MSESVVSDVKGRFISVSEVMNRFGKVGKKNLSESKSRAFFPSQWCLKFVQWVKGISDSLECLCQCPRSKKRLVKCERKVCFNANGRFMFLICE